MALENLKLLEEKIAGFLARYDQLRHEKTALVMRLKEQEQAYAALVEQVQQYEKERNEVRERLEKILNKFNGIYDVNEDKG
ncbi:MAG: cell division protein ZapB [Thermodesulfobacteriota bacterium]|jgi:predicted  nucleic acid-binding Zn-ribbon protein